MTGTPRRAAPTLEAVAARAGVSRATAGRVLAGSGRVNEPARRAVLTAAEELAYVTNHAARSLMTRRSDSVAFVVAESEDRFFADPFFAALLRGVHRVVAEHDRQLTFIVASGEDDRRKLERFAAGGHVDGVMLVSLHGADPLPGRLRRSGVPVVVCGRPPVSDPPVAHVDADNVGGSRLATRHLLDRGARHIVHVAGPADTTVAQDRLLGFRAELATAMTAAGDDRPALADRDVVVRGDFSVESGRAAMGVLLARRPELDGVVAASDLMAIGAMQALESAGRRVPDDVAVVGFDDVPIAESARPPLTTIRQPLDAMGVRLAQLLLDVIDGTDGTDAASVVLRTELVRRASA